MLEALLQDIIHHLLLKLIIPDRRVWECGVLAGVMDENGLEGAGDAGTPGPNEGDSPLPNPCIFHALGLSTDSIICGDVQG